MRIDLPLDIDSVKGFLNPIEGEALHHAALECARRGPCLEIGSYCGKSTVYLGTACQRAGAVLFAVDHHRGSEEHQPGEEYHDPQLYDPAAGLMDSFRAFRATLRRAGLEDTVVPVVAPTWVAARQWATPLSLVFIDGGTAWRRRWSTTARGAPTWSRAGSSRSTTSFPTPPTAARRRTRSTAWRSPQGCTKNCRASRRLASCGVSSSRTSVSRRLAGVCSVSASAASRIAPAVQVGFSSGHSRSSTHW